MNSMPQHAVAKGKGQSEFFRAQLTISSRRVTMKSAPCGPPAGGPWCAGSVPLPPDEAIAAILFHVASTCEIAWLSRGSRAANDLVRAALSEPYGVREALHVGHPVEIDEAVQVIDLVLEDARVVARRLEVDALAGAIQRPHANRREARNDPAPQKWYRQAAFGILFLRVAHALVRRVEE